MRMRNAQKVRKREMVLRRSGRGSDFGGGASAELGVFGRGVGVQLLVHVLGLTAAHRTESGHNKHSLAQSAATPGVSLRRCCGIVSYGRSCGTMAMRCETVA
eukprot:3916053-Rhodomonas_salina.2